MHTYSERPRFILNLELRYSKTNRHITKKLSIKNGKRFLSIIACASYIASFIFLLTERIQKWSSIFRSHVYLYSDYRIRASRHTHNEIFFVAMFFFSITLTWNKEFVEQDCHKRFRNIYSKAANFTYGSQFVVKSFLPIHKFWIPCYQILVWHTNCNFINYSLSKTIF